MQINLDNVHQVYSGATGKCCCGCAGKHTYSSKFQGFSSSHRGYAVSDDEVSDRSVKTIVNKIQKAAEQGRIEFVTDEFVSAVSESGERVLCAYFKEKDPEFVEL